MANGLKAVLAVSLSLVAATLIVYLYSPGFLLDGGKKALRWHAGISRHTTQVDDHLWAYLEGGKGETLLFVPGSPSFPSSQTVHPMKPLLHIAP